MNIKGSRSGRVGLGPRADVRPLKEFVREELPVHSTLRAVVLAEPDTMDPREFLRKVLLWDSLLRKEKKQIIRPRGRPTHARE